MHLPRQPHDMSVPYRPSVKLDDMYRMWTQLSNEEMGIIGPPLLPTYILVLRTRASFVCLGDWIQVSWINDPGTRLGAIMAIQIETLEGNDTGIEMVVIRQKSFVSALMVPA